MESDRRIFAITQKELSTSEPGERDLYAVGTVCHILQIVKTSDTTVRVVVEGESRARLLRLWQTQPFLQGQAELLPEQPARSTARTPVSWPTSLLRTSPSATRIASACWRSCTRRSACALSTTS